MFQNQFSNGPEGLQDELRGEALKVFNEAADDLAEALNTIREGAVWGSRQRLNEMTLGSFDPLSEEISDPVEEILSEVMLSPEGEWKGQIEEMDEYVEMVHSLTSLRIEQLNMNLTRALAYSHDRTKALHLAKAEVALKDFKRIVTHFYEAEKEHRMEFNPEGAREDYDKARILAVRYLGEDHKAVSIIDSVIDEISG